MMGSASKFIDPDDRSDSFRIWDDFLYYVDADLWTITKDVAAAVADSDSHGGILTFSTSNVDENEAYIATTQAVVLPAANKPATVKARFQYTEVGANTANVIFGLSSASGANSMADASGGPSNNYSGAVFFKVDGGTKWQVESSNGATQTTTATRETAGGAAYHEHEIDINPISSSSAEVIFKYDGDQIKDANGDTIKHTLSLTALAAMKILFGIKTGSAADQTANLDYIAFVAKR